MLKKNEMIIKVPLELSELDMFTCFEDDIHEDRGWVSIFLPNLSSALS